MTTANAWVIHKFGGTSVAGADRYRHVADIVRGLHTGGQRVAVVVSAMAKVTDALLRCVNLSAKRDARALMELTGLETRHVDTARELLAPDEAERVAAIIRADVRDIVDILRAVYLMRSHSETIGELVSGYGELWSAQLLGAHLGAPWLDARRVLVVSHGDLGPVVDWAMSTARMRAFESEANTSLVVVTGYVASTAEGTPTTLKRNGSDFSASIFGALLDAKEIVIWTDVDGILSADPRRVPEALVLDRMSYEEAMELAYFGAKVVHPLTMQPAVTRGIPIWIKNTFRPEVRGTVITTRDEQADAMAVKGFSTVDGIALLNVEGTGMIGVPGVAERLFGALRNVGVSVVMISQASSEHSICFAVPDAQGAQAKLTVERAFQGEIHQGHIERVSVVPHCSVLAAVGDGMVSRPGVAARFFGALGQVGVNIRAVAQGSSERNISAVIDQQDSTRALRAVHAGFTLSDQTLSLGVVGPGNIGKTLLAQLAAQTPSLREQLHIDLRVRAIADSKRMLLSDEPIDLLTWRAHFEKDAVALEWSRFADDVGAELVAHAAVVDCTSSDAVADQYAGLLARGIHVVTPNKKAGAGPLQRVRAIRTAMCQGRAQWLYEATVGAGLPVITTLKDLVTTGDRVLGIEGVLSGTLSWLFNGYAPDKSFAALVKEARGLGYTEPDPRDDLSGMDVARKLVILAREIGRDVEVKDVVVESLVPSSLAALPTADAFLEALPSADAAMSARAAAAEREGRVLRYVGALPLNGAPRVELMRVPRTHPFARIAATDNVFAFRTTRYDKQPLIVQGPGAGPDVTAGGVFADLLRLATSL
jgi:aspartokinase/homoserine dehydrogenase 1